MATELTPPLPPQAYVDVAPSKERSAFFPNVTRFINRLIVGSLLCLIVIVAVPYGTAEPWWEAFFECAIFGLTALWIIEGWMRGVWNIAERTLFLPLIVLVLFALFQALPLGGAPATMEGTTAAWRTISVDPFNTLRFALQMTALILTGLLLLSHVNSQKRLRALILTIICVALVSALFGLLRQTAQREAAGFFLPYLPPRTGYGQFINGNHFAYLMELSLGLPLSFVLSRSLGRKRWLLFAGLATPLLLALVLANSRGGLLGLTGEFLFIVLLANQPQPGTHVDDSAARSTTIFSRLSQVRWLRRLAGVVLTLVLLFGISWVGGDSLINKLEAVSGEVSQVDESAREGTRRIEIWRATWRMIAENPLTGVGFNGYAVAIPHYHIASGNLIPQQAHNDYLEILASGGIIGAALWLWFFVAFIRRAHQSLRATIGGKQRAVCVGALAGIAAIAIHSLVDFGLHITINSLICIALLVIVVLTPKLERVDKNTPFRLSLKV